MDYKLTIVVHVETPSPVVTPTKAARSEREGGWTGVILSYHATD